VATYLSPIGLILIGISYLKEIEIWIYNKSQIRKISLPQGIGHAMDVVCR
jgi:hypothetical protein